MPTYEYRCRDCGHSFDIVQKMSDDALTHCPECGGDLRKVFAPPAISFKGSGFYATDHGKKSKVSTSEAQKKPQKKDAASTGGDGGGGEATSGGGTKDTKRDSSGSSAPSSDTKKEGSS